MTMLSPYAPSNGAWVDASGRLTPAAQVWLRDLYLRVGGPSGVDHGELIGLADDDHPQYLNTTRASLLYQPLDSDLTAIAALTTTAFGRALLALAGSAAMTETAFSGLPSGNTTTPDEIVVKQGGVWVRLTWATFLTIVNGSGSAGLDFSQASNSQYIGAVYL